MRKRGRALRSDKINALRDKGSHPTDLAFLAMTHQQLGHAKEAEAELQLLRERMKDPRWAHDARLRASCAKRKNCWQNPSRPAASKQAWAARGRVQAFRVGSKPPACCAEQATGRRLRIMGCRPRAFASDESVPVDPDFALIPKAMRCIMKQP